VGNTISQHKLKRFGFHLRAIERYLNCFGLEDMSFHDIFEN